MRFFLLTTTLFAFAARAQAPFGAVAEVEAPLAATNPLDPTASGSEAERRDDTSVADLLVEVPGTHVARTGGPGSFTSVALRGASLGHTTFLIGDLPLTGPDTGPLDLALWPAEAFAGLEVYRGGAPTWLGAGGIGGVVRLLPRADRTNSLGASLTTGSFGSWAASVNAAVGSDDVRLVSSVGADGSRGDYPFRFDNATLLDPSDDEDRRRRNADTQGAHGLVHLTADHGDGTFNAVIAGVSRNGGMPGPGASGALDARLRRTRLLGTVGYVYRLPNARLQLAAGGGVERRNFLDRFGEIGLGFQSTDDWIENVMLRAAAEIDLAPWLQSTTVVVARWDGVQPNNTLGREAGDSSRWMTTAATELRLHGRLGDWRAELRPSFRVEHADTRAQGLRHNQPEQYNRTRTLPTGRVGAVLSPAAPIALVGSLATGARFPAVWELFGDRATVEANPDLRPERGRSADAGFVLRGRRGPLRAHLEARYFHLDLDQLIRPRRATQETVKFENANSATVQGLELGSGGTLGAHLRWGAALTWMKSRHRGGELNWRPRLRAQFRPEVHSGPVGAFRDLSLFASVVHRGAFFNDPANLVRVEGTTWVGAGIRADFPQGLSFQFQARDLFDQRGQDYVGFPLPGRRVSFLVRYRMEL
ncbi:MAG: TonB-dependent receptor [Myxococcota bacterium]